MTLKTTLLGACIAAFCLCQNGRAAAKPNIVFIMADDLGWADVAFHGGNAPTPHLDKLAAENLELTHHYVAPVCSPTRTALMTGRFWSRFGVTQPQNNRALPWDTVTLPRALKSVGYDTCLTGKWHLGSLPEEGPNHFGFDHAYGSLAGGVGPWDHFYKQGPFSVTWHRDEKLITEQGHVTDLITAEAIKWIGERGAAPFFLYVPFTAVHLPLKEPKEWESRVPASITGEVPRHYAASIMHLDDSVAKIIDALERAGKRDNTLLVFTSDNGGSTSQNNDTKYPADDYPSGSIPGNNLPLRGKKGDVFEGGIRVPAIVSWPGMVSPGKTAVPFHIADWMPTFCAAAGAKPDGDLRWDGADMTTVLKSGSKAAKSARMLYWTAPGFSAVAVSDGTWKLIVTGKGEKKVSALFNIATDPNESMDVSATEPAMLAKMSAALKEISASDNDRKVTKAK
jgi:arylsulfatase A-like enzyme